MLENYGPLVKGPPLIPYLKLVFKSVYAQNIAAITKIIVFPIGEI